MKLRELAAITAVCLIRLAPIAYAKGPLDSPLAQTKRDFRGDFFMVCETLSIGCGVEQVSDETSDLPKEGHSLRKMPREVLDDYVASHPGVVWSYRDGVIDLAPSKGLEGDPLGAKIDAISLHGMSGFLAAGEVFFKAGIPFTYQIMGRTQLFKPIELELKDVTVRQALNAIAHADGQMMWIVAQFPKGGKVARLTFTTASWRKEGIPFSVEERKRLRLYRRD